uniref:Uncharacterized protein n=2 Tax=Homininae TaxID=207598 RepID=A0A2I3SDW2_PANTR
MCLPRNPHHPTLLLSRGFIISLCIPHVFPSCILLKGKPREASGWVGF